MPRDMVQTACQYCRKKRLKCNGQIPCQRCEEDGEVCEYNYSRRDSKDELRAEIERLKKINEKNKKLLSDLAPNQDPSARQTAHKRLINRSGSHEKGFREEEGVKYSAGPSRIAKRRRASSTTSNEKVAGSPCFGQLRSWKSCYPRIDDNNLSGNTPERATSSSLPPLPLDAYTFHSHTDTWTRTGWTRAHIHHLFDALYTWEYLPFSLLAYDLFLSDFHSGSSRFCSSTLVHAILALATRLVNENKDETEVPPSGWFRSKIFFDEAKSEVQNGGSPSDRLPDIQALGILSLYEIRCGREAEAQIFAQEFLTSITELCQRKSTTGEEGDEQYTRVRTSTYCGAVSLNRILPLTTGQLFDTRNHELREDLSILDQLSSDIGETLADNSFNYNFTAVTHSSQLCKYQAIMRMVFRLTEWVHKVITSAQSGIQMVLSDVEDFYKNCLEWYESIFALLNAEGSRSPFALFIHMYYHFGLLCAFRPFISIPVEHPSIQPYHICKQSAQSILALAQSYDDLFTLRRVSALIPYFVCTSGLFSLALEGEGSPSDTVHLRLGDPPSLNTAQLREYNSVATNHYGYSTTPSYFKISATVHASLLLAKMSSTHPAASLAQKALGESNEGSDLEMRG